MQTERTVFEYQSAVAFLTDAVATRQRTDSDFSIRKWSKSIGFASHTLLIMIIQGKRSLLLKHAKPLAEGLRLTSPEHLYFRALIQRDHAQSDEERSLIDLWLSELNPGSTFRAREVDEYLVIAHWVHMAILALSETEQGIRSVEDVMARLKRHELNTLEVRSAFQRLKDLGLIEERAGLWHATCARITSRDDVANRGAREYHRQVAKLASDSLERLPLEEREFQSFALALSQEQVPLAKEMIRRFRTQLEQALGNPNRDEVYQCNLHFFKLS